MCNLSKLCFPWWASVSTNWLTIIDKDRMPHWTFTVFHITKGRMLTANINYIPLPSKVDLQYCTSLNFKLFSLMLLIKLHGLMSASKNCNILSDVLFVRIHYTLRLAHIKRYEIIRGIHYTLRLAHIKR